MTVLAWIVVLIALAELGARSWIRRQARYYVWAPGARSDLRLSPDVSPRLHERVRFEVNRDGERGSEAAPPGRECYRVLVAGGSCVESLLVDQPASWPGALEHALATPASLRALGSRRVHVGNIGRSGVATRELNLILARVLPRYPQLDAIVLMVGAGDVVQWLEQGAPCPFPPSSIAVQRCFACHPEGPFGWRPGTWAISELLRRLRRRWLRPVEVTERVGRWYADARAMRARAREVRTVVPDPAVMLDRFDDHLRHALLRARAHARRVLVVPQPWFEKEAYTTEEESQLWHGGMGLAWREPVTTYYSLDVVNRLMRLVYARAARVAEQAGVEHLDLRPRLEPSLEHYYDHVHFTPAGSAVVAWAVADALLRLADVHVVVPEKIGLGLDSVHAAPRGA